MLNGGQIYFNNNNAFGTGTITPILGGASPLIQRCFFRRWP